MILSRCVRTGTLGVSVCPLVGLYPVVGWKIGSEVVYLAEGNAADTGTAIKWAQELGEC